MEESPFEVSDIEVSNGKFLWLIPKKYVKSLYGASHGIAALTSSVLGNYLFLCSMVLGDNGTDDDDPFIKKIKLTFYISTIWSALIVYLFYWNKVQSWQLSTTSKEDKGITSKTLQNLNKGRTAGLIVHALFPLAVYMAPCQHVLADQAVSSGVAMLLLTLSVYAYMLIKDYGKGIFMVYGAYATGLGLSILKSSGDGTIAGLMVEYPDVLDHTDKMAYMQISCVQFGFLLYYMYSRRLVQKATVQNLCKNYHPVMILVWFARLQIDHWWNALPPPMLVVPTLISLLLGLFLFKIVKSLLPPNKTSEEIDEADEANPQEKEQPTRATAPRQNRRRSSIFEVTAQSSRRRSSLLESIDVGLFENLDDAS